MKMYTYVHTAYIPLHTAFQSISLKQFNEHQPEKKKINMKAIQDLFA